MHPLLLLTQSRFKEFYREPSALFWTFGFPILLTVVLGFAFRNQKSPPQPVGLVGDADGRYLRALQSDLLKVSVLSEDAAEAQLRHADLVLLVRVTPAGVDYVYDPQRSEAPLARAAVDGRLQSSLGRRDVLAATDVKVQAAGSRYIDWMVPGLIGVQLMSGSLWGVALVLVQSRQKKLLKRLAATPMRRSDFLGSFILWRLIFVVTEVAVLLVFAHFAFAVPVKGSLVWVLVMSLLGAACFAGIGLLCAARAQNTETANGLINLVQLPMYLVSGVFFSASRFPAWAQLPIHLLPLTALNDSLRAVINEGQGPSAFGLPILVMAVWGTLSTATALRIFKWA